MVAGTGLKACCLPAGYLPLWARQGTRLPHHLAHHHWPAIGGSAIGGSALGVATSMLSSKHGLHEHNSFFSSAARGWQMAPCGAGDPFDCGRRARKSRWKAAPAQNRRGSSCWSRKSRCCGLGTLRDCSLAAASVACSALALTNAALAKPTATVALANPAIVIAASVVSQSAAAVALAATAVALSPPPGHHHRHRHRPRRHGLRHPLPGRRRRRLRLRLRLCRRCPARLVRLRRPRLPRHCRGTRRLSHSVAPHRDGSIGVRNVVVFS